MAANSNIEWTDATWTCITGCTRVSEGCDHCYSARMTHRLEMMGQQKYTGLTVLNPKGDRHFNGVVKCHDDCLTIPFKWKKPRRIFVNSMSDTFHKEVPFEFIDKVFAVMALCPQHTFQVLTKRPGRMAEYFAAGSVGHRIYQQVGRWLDDGEDGLLGRSWDHAHQLAGASASGGIYEHTAWNVPLKNVWLGTSIENQEQADKRIPELLRCPAAVRFLSAEPLLAAVDLSPMYVDTECPNYLLDGSPPMMDPETGVRECCKSCDYTGVISESAIDWVIVGSESGAGRRPMKTEWAESIRDQCKAAGVPFFMKQMSVNGRISGDIELFPKSLQIREFPRASTVASSV